MDRESGNKRIERSETMGFSASVLVFALLGFVALAFLTAWVAVAYPVSSDDATGVLEAAAVLRGNVLLTGWTVSNISFVTTDLPFYIAGVAIKGLNPSLLRDVPSFVYAVAVGAAVVLAALGRRSPLLAAATVLVLLALPAGGLAEFVTKGYTRVGTSIGLFAGLIALEGPISERVSWKRLAFYVLATALTLLSDTFTMVIAVTAVLIVSVLGVVRRETYEGLGLTRVAVGTVLAVVLAQAASAGLRGRCLRDRPPAVARLPFDKRAATHGTLQCLGPGREPAVLVPLRYAHRSRLVRVDGLAGLLPGSALADLCDMVGLPSAATSSSG